MNTPGFSISNFLVMIYLNHPSEMAINGNPNSTHMILVFS